MTKLSDTHAFLWFIEDSPKLSAKAIQGLKEPDSELCLSLVSIWEIAIKVGINKLKLPLPLKEFLRSQIRTNEIQLLNVNYETVVSAGLLPLHQRDPFDRLIIAQALSEHLPVISSDQNFDRYGITRIW
jgi:PIN domain nuclease of toxin-antitoxin system